MPITPTTLLTTRATAALLKVGTSTLSTWRRNGEGPPFVVLGPRLIRYRLADIEAWTASLGQEDGLNSTSIPDMGEV